jgi:hypothetical protein
MTLPPNFSTTEHLQDLVRRFGNKEVNQWFRDVDDETNIQAPRATLKLGCLHQELDSINQTILRVLLFWLIVSGEERFGTHVYGIPFQEYQETVRFDPQIMLYFEEPYETREEFQGRKMPGVTGEISIRIRGRKYNTISKSELTSLANQIKASFGGSNPKKWRKGKSYFTYVDKEKGYKFQLLVSNRSDGRELVSDVLRLVGETPNWENANWKENEDASSSFPDARKTELVLGEVRPMPKRRPIKTVEFQYAICHVWGVSTPIALYDRTGAFPQAILRD